MPRKLVIFSQTFVPDPASVGQHVADVAIEMARRGYRVKVFASDRGYDDPTAQYKRREIIPPGVEVYRFPFSSFGKKSILTRGIGTASFMIQSVFRGLIEPDVDAILFSTSPPLIGIAMTIIRMFREIPLAYWAMDLNPDQLLALGKLKPRDDATRFLEASNQMILRNSSLIFALDRFMADRLKSRGKYVEKKLRIIPPWPHESVVAPIAHCDNPFRERHGLTDKFVVMYSGNHSPSNPLDTLLSAAERLKDDGRVRFLFIGGGIGKKAVEQFIQSHSLTNAMSLPYQPMSELRYSLSAADVHVVSLGENMVGIIHPCKVYGAMTVGRPILFFGPEPSHVADLLRDQDIGKHVNHGDVEGAVDAIRGLIEMGEQKRNCLGMKAQRVLAASLSQPILCGRFCDELGTMFPR